MINDKNSWWVLLVTTSATALVFLDQTVMPIALPAIQNHFSLSDIDLIWVVNVYLLATISLLLIGGRLAELWGERRLYLIGLTLFGFSSILGGMSFSASSLLFARVVQGVGAAITLPTTVALLIRAFPPDKRARAIGINAGISAIFLALGPLIGGVLTEYISWRMIFWINIPIILFAILASLFLIKVESVKSKENFHFSGAFTLIISVVAFVVALMQGNIWGWSSLPIVLLLFIAPLFGALFVSLSLKEKHPLLDFKVFLLPSFSGAVLAIFMTQLMIAITLFWAIYFQVQLEYSPAKTGFVILIATLPVLIAAPFAGYLADHYGAKLPMSIGFMILIGALGWVAFFGLQGEISLLAPGLLGFGFGIPMIFSPAIAVALSYVPREKLASSSAITTAARQLAATMGVACMTALFEATLANTSSYSHAFAAVSLLAAFFAFAGFASVCFIIPNKKLLEN